MSNYKKLDAWLQSMQLVKEIYIITKTFPKEELYALTSQTKRAAVSVPCKTLLNIAVMVEIISEGGFSRISSLIDKCMQLLNGLIRYYEKSNLK